MSISRRHLLGAAALAPAAFTGVAWARDLSRGDFTHGVASGDPLADAVVIWTRFVGAGDGRIGWEIAEDEGFTRVAHRGQTIASATSDYCAKVDVRGLQPNRTYFYRFLSASGPSMTGQTRTAPRRGGDSLSVALFSCANYPYGFFHAYGHAAQRDDIDLVLHVGDYIYEYGRGEYPNDNDQVPGRLVEPATEIIHLQDYNRRYQQYHTDANLLELRRRKPISCVWDDHEFCNDTWREGAQNHQASEGAFSDRVAAASKAYFDWMPIRRPDRSGPRVYRSLDWGDLARILLLDTRLIGRDRQIDYRTTLMPRLAQGGGDAAAVVAEFRRTILDDPNRTMMGAAQEQWFARTLQRSKSRGQTWQIVAQQVVMGDQIAAAGMSRLLPADAPAFVRQTVAGGEQAGRLGLPWNLDSWGGYEAARTRLLSACTEHANNAIVLGGDSHNCWLNNLPAPSGGRLAAVEFAGGSVSSPGFERALTGAQPGERESVMRSGNPNLAWCDLTNRGYGKLTFTPSACNSEWIALSDVRSEATPATTITRFSSAAGAAGPSAWSVSA